MGLELIAAFWGDDRFSGRLAPRRDGGIAPKTFSIWLANERTLGTVITGAVQVEPPTLPHRVRSKPLCVKC